MRRECAYYTHTMNSTQHTPGPWTMRGPSLRANGYNIGSVNSHGTTEGAANARLIAAAPDLLAACGELLATVKIYSSNAEPQSIRQLEINRATAAITKATQP